MFNAERVLGSLLKNVTGSRGGGILDNITGSRGGLNKASIGMGVVGLAVAAYEHYTKDQSNPKSQPSQPSTPPPPVSPPPMQVTSQSNTNSVPPPPPPPAGIKAEAQQTSMLLIEAMIAAANADGEIDMEERNTILTHLQSAGSDQEGLDYFQSLLENPPKLNDILKQVNNNDLAQQVYTVSLLAIRVDTDDEQLYLDGLANGLELTDAQVNQLDEQFKS